MHSRLTARKGDATAVWRDHTEAKITAARKAVVYAVDMDAILEKAASLPAAVRELRSIPTFVVASALHHASSHLHPHHAQLLDSLHFHLPYHQHYRLRYQHLLPLPQLLPLP